MDKKVILKYIDRIKKEDIINYGLKEGIRISDNDLIIIYDYIKNKAINILDNPLDIIMEIKDKIDNKVFQKILELYDKYKDIIKKLK